MSPKPPEGSPEVNDNGTFALLVKNAHLFSCVFDVTEIPTELTSPVDLGDGRELVTEEVKLAPSRYAELDVEGSLITAEAFLPFAFDLFKHNIPFRVSTEGGERVVQFSIRQKLAEGQRAIEEVDRQRQFLGSALRPEIKSKQVASVMWQLIEQANQEYDTQLFTEPLDDKYELCLERCSFSVGQADYAASTQDELSSVAEILMESVDPIKFIFLPKKANPIRGELYIRSIDKKD